MSPQEQSPPLDLQAIRRAGTTAATVLALPGKLPSEDVRALDEAIGYLRDVR